MKAPIILNDEELEKKKFRNNLFQQLIYYYTELKTNTSKVERDNSNYQIKQIIDNINKDKKNYSEFILISNQDGVIIWGDPTDPDNLKKQIAYILDKNTGKYFISKGIEAGAYIIDESGIIEVKSHEINYHGDIKNFSENNYKGPDYFREIVTILDLSNKSILYMYNELVILLKQDPDEFNKEKIKLLIEQLSDISNKKLADNYSELGLYPAKLDIISFLLKKNDDLYKFAFKKNLSWPTESLYVIDFIIKDGIIKNIMTSMRAPPNAVIISSKSSQKYGISILEYNPEKSSYIVHGDKDDDCIIKNINAIPIEFKKDHDLSSSQNKVMANISLPPKLSVKKKYHKIIGFEEDKYTDTNNNYNEKIFLFSDDPKFKFMEFSKLNGEEKFKNLKKSFILEVKDEPYEIRIRLGTPNGEQSEVDTEIKTVNNGIEYFAKIENGKISYRIGNNDLYSEQLVGPFKEGTEYFCNGCINYNNKDIILDPDNYKSKNKEGRN